MPDMSSGFRHIFGCMYIYMYIYMMFAANFVLQVAVGCFSVCYLFVLCRILGSNEFNLPKSYNFDLKFDKPLKYLNCDDRLL